MLGNIIAAGANLVGGIIGSNKESKIAKQNIAMQKQFAQEGIRWKVADAKAAGLHPLAALGAQTSSFSPISVGGNSLATGLAAAGQDIGRAVNATRTSGERIDAYTKTVQDLNLRRLGLENDLLASQIAKINQAGSPPPFPTAGNRHLIEGQGNSPLIKSDPMEQTPTDPLNPSSEPGSNPEVGYARTTAGWAPVPSKAIKERIEDNFPAEVTWMMRNQMAPSFGFRSNPPKIDIPEGHFWQYNPFTQEYVLRRFPQSRLWNGGFINRRTYQ